MQFLSWTEHASSGAVRKLVQRCIGLHHRSIPTPDQSDHRDQMFPHYCQSPLFCFFQFVLCCAKFFTAIITLEGIGKSNLTESEAFVYQSGCKQTFINWFICFFRSSHHYRCALSKQQIISWIKQNTTTIVLFLSVQTFTVFTINPIYHRVDVRD